MPTSRPDLHTHTDCFRIRIPVKALDVVRVEPRWIDPHEPPDLRVVPARPEVVEPEGRLLGLAGVPDGVLAARLVGQALPVGGVALAPSSVPLRSVAATGEPSASLW